VPHRSYSIFDGSTFVVSDGRGDLRPLPGQAHGFFCDDTRFLSDWVLTLDGEQLDTLSVADLDYFAVEFFLIPPSKSIYRNPCVSVIRRRLVRSSWVEEIVVMNHRNAPVNVDLRLAVRSDFADLFEVKDAAVMPRKVLYTSGADELVLRYERDRFVRETRIVGAGNCEVHDDGFYAHLRLEPQEEWRTGFEIVGSSDQPKARLPTHTPAVSLAATGLQMREDVAAWVADVPEIETDWEELRNVYRQSVVDLAALRFYPEVVPGASLPAAGLPWFMTLFGRDSLITSYQVLPLHPGFARTTLLALAALQADDHDDFHEREPGKILHELRFGELTVFGDMPHAPYYGTADATPLFLVLLDEYERWSGDVELVRQLEPNARAALAWIDRHGDRDGDGYVEYERRNERSGLVNQCWKDSWNSILFADGSLAEPPIATCEIQGYVYDAKRRCARLAAEVWNDPELGARLEHEAADLRRRFHEDFWVTGGDYPALALDRGKRRVDSLTSNIGHLLWSGILDDDAAAAVVSHLMGERLFSGWGVRTMAAGDLGYNPLEYHNGTVWPHDNSLIAEGLRRYGYRAEAARIGVALVDASARFAACLPEVFAGYSRERTQWAVEYPTASRPQAWATGTPLLFVRTVLGLEPGDDGPRVQPWLPDRVRHLALRGVQGPSGRVDVSAGPADVAVP